MTFTIDIMDVHDIIISMPSVLSNKTKVTHCMCNIKKVTLIRGGIPRLICTSRKAEHMSCKGE